MVLLLTLACSDYELAQPPAKPEIRTNDGEGVGLTDDDLTDPEPPTDPLDEVEEPLPDEPPPPFLDTPCPDARIAGFSDEEIWVGSRSHTSATGVLTAPSAGWYHVYNEPIVESGSSQHNESAWFRVVSDTDPDGLPLFGNCGEEYVVVDADNDGPPPGVLTLIGTFWLDAGENDLVMRHYCELYRDGECPEHHEDSPSSQTCDSNNINSVHFTGHGVCLIPAR